MSSIYIIASLAWLTRNVRNKFLYKGAVSLKLFTQVLQSVLK